MMFGNQRITGAVDGAYRVMVSSRFSLTTAVQTYLLKSPVRIKPKDNHLVVEVDPASAMR